MASRRVVVLAMPNNEVVEVGGLLDIFYAVNERTTHVDSSEMAYAVEVVSPVETVCAWPGSGSSPSGRTARFEVPSTP